MKILIIVPVLLFFACTQQPQEKIDGEWIKGTKQEKIHTIEKQFRGFDNTMVEIGYRYQELYWAGKDENWDYATYQIEKMKLTIENGLERRPKRAKSADHFLKSVLPEMLKSVQQRDTVIFNENFDMLTANCINCHSMEKVPYFTVKKPIYRQSPIRK